MFAKHPIIHVRQAFSGNNNEADPAEAAGYRLTGFDLLAQRAGILKRTTSGSMSFLRPFHSQSRLVA